MDRHQEDQERDIAGLDEVVELRGWKRGLLSALLLFAVAVLGSGCSSLSTQTKFYTEIQSDLRAGNYAAAIAAIERAKEEGKYAEKDRFLYFFDSGLAYHFADSFATSTERLSAAEAAAEELFTKSISRAAASLLLNDNVLEYAGEDHEVLYANLFKALNFLALEDNEGALVEIRRANLKLQQLEQKYFEAANAFRAAQANDSNQVELDYDVKPVRFANSAFARYLGMHLFAADQKWDDARIDRQLLEEAMVTQPEIYDFPMPAVDYQASGTGQISVLALVGSSPVKNDLKLRLRTDKQLDLVQILYDGADDNGPKYGHFPVPISEDYYFKFAIPVMTAGSSEVQAIRVRVNGEPFGELALLEDVNKVAAEIFSAKKTLIYVRTVARALAKGLAAHEVKAKIDKDNKDAVGKWLLKFAVDVGTDVLENADLRCSRLLPGRIYAGDFALGPGRYDVELEFVDADGVVIGTVSRPGFLVKPGKFNLATSYFPR